MNNLFNIIKGIQEFNNTPEIEHFGISLTIFFTLAGLLLFMISALISKNRINNGWLAGGIIIFIIPTILGILLGCFYEKAQKDKLMNRVNNMISEEYPVYLNGQAINPDTVIINRYDIYIQNDMIILSEKRR